MTRLEASVALVSALALAVPAAAQQRPEQPADPPANPHRIAPPSPGFETPPPRMPIAEQDNMAFGVGLFSVTGHFIRDRGARGREPMIEPGGRESKVAAVGLSLRF